MKVPNRSHRLKKTTTKLKNTLEGLNTRLDEAKKESRIQGSGTQTEQQNRKQILKSEIKEPVGQTSSRIAFTLLGSQKEKREKGEQKTYFKK